MHCLHQTEAPCGWIFIRKSDLLQLVQLQVLLIRKTEIVSWFVVSIRANSAIAGGSSNQKNWNNFEKFCFLSRTMVAWILNLKVQFSERSRWKSLHGQAMVLWWNLCFAAKDWKWTRLRLALQQMKRLANFVLYSYISALSSASSFWVLLFFLQYISHLRFVAFYGALKWKVQNL